MIILNNLKLRHPIYDDEYSEFKNISDYEIDICIDDEIEPKKIGFMKYTIIKYNKAVHDHVDILDVLDEHTTELSTLIPFFENGVLEPYHSETEIHFDNSIKPNFLYIHIVDIEKKYRGKGYSLTAERMLRDFYNEECYFNCLQPYPTDKKLTKESIKNGIIKLRNHWSKNGYKQLGKTDMFYRI